MDDISLTDKPLVGSKLKKATGENHTKKQANHLVLAPTATIVENTPSQPDVLPIGAKVTLVDYGHSVATNPADGRFSMTHKAGEFTLRAEAYGFHSKSKLFRFQKTGSSNQTLLLNL